MKTPSFLRLALLVCALLIGFGRTPVACGQTVPAPQSADEKRAIAHKIARTDRLSLSIVGEPDLNVGNKRVDASGNINLALVGDVHVAGFTVTEAQTIIEDAYRDGRFLRNPQVTINIEEYAPQTVSITGLVKGGGTFNIPPETVMTLRDLIQKAGGLAETANGSKVKITRTLPDGTTKVFTKDVEALLKGRASPNSTDANFPLEPDDIVYVPEKII